MTAMVERRFPFLLAAIVAASVAVVVFGFGKAPSSKAIPAATMTFGIVVAGFTATQRNMLLGMQGSSVMRFLSRTEYSSDVLDYLMHCIYSALLVSIISLVGIFLPDCGPLWGLWIVSVTFTVVLVLALMWRNELMMSRIIRHFLKDPDNSANQ